MNSLVRALPAMLSLLPALVGQSDAVRTSFGVTTHEGVLRGLGPDYSARFETNGVTFTPMLGDRVTEPATLRFTLTSVRRGGTNVFARSRDIAPVAVANQVRYPHDANVVETYDVRQDGIEQGFVFAQRPAGTGDLVVRGQITTELPLTTASDDGARFERAGAGGVTFGAVTGVDANGVRMRGSLRCDGRWLELSLPASFVDSAAYPLVLDPLIGSSFLIANIAGGSDVQPSVAYDETTQRYLVVWSIPMSTATAEVRAALVTAAGFLGPQMLLDATSVPGIRPAVANINQRNRFVVAWANAANVISVVAIDAATAAVSASTPVFATGLVGGLALGGDSRIPFAGAADNALLVHTWRSTPNLQAAYRSLLQVPAAGAPTHTGPLPIIPNVTSEIGPPTVAKHAGSAGRWMCMLARRTTSAVVIWDAFVVRTNGAFCDSATWSVGSTSTFDLRTAAATSNGSEFLVAYETNDQDVELRRLQYSGTLTCGSGTLTGGFGFSPSATNAGHQYPELDCARDKYVLAYRQPSASNVAQIRVLGVGLQDGQGSSLLAQFSTSAQIDPAVAARYSGGDGSSDEAMVTWASAGIRGRLWQATGTGTVTSLGGACGIPGLSDVNTYTGTPVIGTTFSISLLAPTAPVLALIVGFTQNPFACGPCTIVPSADIVIPGGGPVPVNVPLDPNLIGFELFTQWLQLRPSGCPILPDFGFSNTLKFTIAE